jgi:hypothetical protein
MRTEIARGLKVNLLMTCYHCLTDLVKKDSLLICNNCNTYVKQTVFTNPNEGQHTISMSYNANKYYGDNKIENQLSQIATKYHGEFTGSGMGFGSRDLSFEFKSKTNATNFIKKALTTKINKTIHYYFYPKETKCKTVTWS